MSDTPTVDSKQWLADDGNGGTHSVVSLAYARAIERELNAANARIKRLEDALIEKRDAAKQRYDEEQITGDRISIASTRSYYLAFKESLHQVMEAKEAKP